MQDVLTRCLEDVLKMSLERLEDVLKMYGQGEYIGFDQDVLKTSSKDKEERRLQDVFRKTNVCWVSLLTLMEYLLEHKLKFHHLICFYLTYKVL